MAFHPDAVAVVDIHPEGSGAVQEAAHFPAIIVEVAGAPLAVAHIAVVLVEVGAVKVGERVALAAKWTGTKSMMTPMPIRWQALIKAAKSAGSP